MVCKKEVCEWFKTLTSSKRLDLMCGLLHMCLPFELRFLGSCIEDLAKKDFCNLRDAEHKANNTVTLTKLTANIFDQETRSKLIIYLSLLYSHNTVCSNIMYDILTRVYQLLSQALQIQSHQQDSRTCSPSIVDRHLAEDVLLLLTSAANHPAFVFSQSQELHNHLQNVEKLLRNHNLLQPEDCVIQTDAETYEHSNSCSSSNSSNGISSSSSSGSSNGGSSCGSSGSSICSSNTSGHPSPAGKQQCCPAAPKPVHVKNLELLLKGSQWRTSDRRHEFLIQVTWSDGEITETYRTYQDLHNFHAELIKLFPKDSGAHKQDRHIPFLPQEKSHSNKEMTEHLRKYIRGLSALPDHMIQCEYMTTFFKANPGTHRGRHHSRGSVTVSPTPPTRGGEDDPSQGQGQGQGHIRSLTIYNSQIGDHTARRMTEQGVRSPRCAVIPTVTANATSMANHRHTYSSTVINSLSPNSSPLPSPLPSPNVSPSPSLQSEGGRCDSPRGGAEQPSTISKWLKKIRLHKYQTNLSKFTWEKLINLSDEELKQEGLTQGACGKFRNEVETLKKNLMMNGMVELTDSSICSTLSASPSSPSWHTPPSSCYLPPPAHPQLRRPYYASSISITSGSIDSSPSCSEFSSPPPSPGPGSGPGPGPGPGPGVGKQRHDSCSSDDDDTGKEDLDHKLEELSLGPARQHPRLPYRLPPNLLQPPLAPPGEKLPGPLSAFTSVASPLTLNEGQGSVMPDVDSYNGNASVDFPPVDIPSKHIIEVRPMHPPHGMRPLMPGFMPAGLDMHSPFRHMYYAHPHMMQHHYQQQSRPPGNHGKQPMQMPMPVPVPVPMPVPNSMSQSVMSPLKLQGPPGAPAPTHTQPLLLPQPTQATENMVATKSSLQDAGVSNTPPVNLTTMQLTLTTTEARKPTMGYHLLPVEAPAISRPTSLGIPPSVAPPSVPPPVSTVLPGSAHHQSADASGDNTLPTVSCSVEVTVPYTIYPSAVNSSCNTVTYSSPTFQTPPLTVHSVTGSGVVELPPSPTTTSSSSATPRQTPTPSAPPTPSAASPPMISTATPSNGGGGPSNGCTSCGCNGQCNQTMPPVSFPYSYPGVWPHGHVFPGFHPMGFMPVNSNGLISPSLANVPFNHAAAGSHLQHHHPPHQHPHPFNMPNGFTMPNPDVLYSHQANFAMMQHAAAASAAANQPNATPPLGHLPFSGGGPHMASQVPPGAKTKLSVSTCCNCGSTGHRREDCKDATMDAIARSGQFHLNYARAPNSNTTS